VRGWARLRIFVQTVTTKTTFVLFSGHGFQRTLSSNPTASGMADATGRCIPAGNVDASGTFFPLSWLQSMDSTLSKGWRRYDP
jgi:hypothetical protein